MLGTTPEGLHLRSQALALYPHQQVPLIALETGCEYGDGSMSNIVYFPHTRLDIGRAVAHVISHLGWMNVVLIYDEQTGTNVKNARGSFPM